jgi:hypothetical protein
MSTRQAMNAGINSVKLQSATGDVVTASFAQITGYQGDPLYLTANVVSGVLEIAISDQPPSTTPALRGSANTATVTVSYNGTTYAAGSVGFGYTGNSLSLGMTIDGQLSTATLTVTEAEFGEDERARRRHHESHAKRKNADGSRTEAPFGFLVVQTEQDASVYDVYWIDTIPSVTSPGRFTSMTLVEPPDDSGGLSGPMGGMIP